MLLQKRKTAFSQERKVGKTLPRKCTEDHCRFASLKRIPGRFTLGLWSFILQSKPPLTLASFSQGQKTCETLTSHCWPLRPLTLYSRKPVFPPRWKDGFAFPLKITTTTKTKMTMMTPLSLRDSPRPPSTSGTCRHSKGTKFVEGARFR